MRSKYIFLIIVIYISSLSGQWNVNLSNSSSATSNLINNYKNVEDVYFYPQFRFSRMSEYFTIYYSGSVVRMVDNSIYNRDFHKMGVNYYQQLNQDLYLSAGSNFFLRRNQDEFSYYDYNQFKAFTTLKYYLKYNVYTKLGVSWQYKGFLEEDAWNHHELSYWTQANISLPTRTTIRLHLNYRSRDFLPYEYVLEDTKYSEEISSLWLIIGSLRLAQSINRKIGLFSEFSYHYNPSEGNPYEVEIDSFSPIDDYFGYKGWNLENNITYRFSQHLDMELNYEFYQRKYLNRAVYAYNFETEEWLVNDEGYYIINESNRSDKGSRVTLTGNYQLERIFGKAATLNFEPYLYFRNNQSNDPYFEYKDYGAGLHINYNFQW